ESCRYREAGTAMNKREIIEAEREVIFHLKLIAQLIEHVGWAQAKVSLPLKETFDPAKNSYERPTDDAIAQQIQSANVLSALWDGVLRAIHAARSGEPARLADCVKELVEGCDLAEADARMNALRVELLDQRPAGSTPIVRPASGEGDRTRSPREPESEE